MTDVSINGLHIQLRVASPYDVVFTAGLDRDFTKADLDSVMDLLTGVADREKLKGELASLRAALRRNTEMLASGHFDQVVDNLRQQRADYDKQVSASWVASSKRGGPQLNGAQKTKMAEFDQQIATAEKAKRDVVNGIPLTEWQIDCLYARINGQAEPEMPDRVLALMPKIELPEDVSFMQSAA